MQWLSRADDLKTALDRLERDLSKCGERRSAREPIELGKTFKTRGQRFRILSHVPVDPVRANFLLVAVIPEGGLHEY